MVQKGGVSIMKRSTLLLTILLLTSSLLLAIPSPRGPFLPAKAANDPPPDGGHVEGDWTVTDIRSYTSCTITLHGNLIIQGSLTFNNVTLLIQSDDQDQFVIDVTGTFNVYDLDGNAGTSADATVISPEELRYAFNMNIAVQATVDMQRSIMRHYDSITILSSNVNFIDNTFTDLSGSGIDVFGAAPTFRGNDISYNAMSGNAFVFYGCNGLVFEDNRIDHPWFHVIADGCEGITFRNNEFLRGDRGIVVHGTTALIEDNYFWWNGKTVVVEEGTAVVRRNTFLQNAAAMATDELTTNDLEAYDNHIEGCGEAFLLPGPGSESTARIHDNTILNCGSAVGLFTGFSARIFDNHIEGCGLALYTDTSASEFYGNTIINNSYVIYSRHGSVIEASNNLMANNILVGYLTEGSMLTLENNAIRFNLMGIHTYERNSGGARAIITGNDIYDNPLFAIWNVDEGAHIEAVNNYWGGVPNEDGDRIVGSDIYYEPYSSSPNDPIAPANPFTPHIVTGSESYQGELDASGPWIVRHGGDLTLDGVDLDLGGFFLGVKNGGTLSASGTIHNGSAMALSSDAVEVFDLEMRDMRTNILAFFGTPHFRNLDLSAPTGGISWHLIPRTLIWSAMSDPTIEDCVFDTDDQTYDIIFDRSSGTVRGCTFSSGRGIEAWYGSIVVEDSTIRKSATGITSMGTHLTLTGNELDTIAVSSRGSDVVLVSNRVANSTLDLEELNATFVDNTVMNSSVDYLGSTVDVDGNRVHGSGLQLGNSEGVFRNNLIESGSRLALSDFRGLIVDNTFKDGDPAISITRGTSHINYNNFLNNAVAISNTGSNRANAVYNYWNSVDGPGGEGAGSGDPISGSIMYEPWAHLPIDKEGALLNFAPRVSLDEYDLLPSKSLLLSGWAWDPDGDSHTVELRIAGSQYDTGWTRPVQFERYPGWTRWYYLWNPNGEDYGSFHPELRVSDGLETSYVDNPGTFLFSPPDYSDHAPIRIDSDAELLLPSSGVTGGSGTESDPYIISGWRITPTGGGEAQAPAIEIRNVQSHVIIEECYFTGGREDSWYISILDSPHITTIRSNVFNASEGGGLYALNELGTPITMNITDNLFAEVESFGVRLKNYSLDASENHVVGDSWTGGPMYVHSLIDGEDALVRDNVYFNTDDAFVFQDIGGEVSGNLFLGCRAGGMIQTLFSDLSIHDNLLASCAFGSIFNGGTPVFENNTFIDNQQVSLYNGQNQGSTAVFRDNTFRNNRDGISNTNGGYSDARYNYWGAPDGPSGEGSGSGDPVDDLTQYEPWYTEGPLGPNHPPGIIFIEPWGDDDTAQDELMLAWYAVDLDSENFTVELGFAPESDLSSPVFIDKLENSYTYLWDVRYVPAGRYRLKATISDGMGAKSDVWSGVVELRGGQPHPTITMEIIEPDGDDDEADDEYTIEWYANDEDGDTLSIALYYDTDSDPDNGKTAITTGLSNTGSYDWDCVLMPEGDYYILGIADDNNGSFASDYSTGRVHIQHHGTPGNHHPRIRVLEPDGDDDEADEEYTISWTASDQDEDTLTIALYHDTDTDPGNGKTLIASGLPDTGSYRWDTSEVDEDDYFICAVVDDGEGGTGDDYSSGTLRIRRDVVPGNHAPVVVISSVNVVDEETFRIWWNASDEDGDTPLVSLYYDNDTDPNNGKVLIENRLDAEGSYDWDISDMDEDNYYVYALADDRRGGEGSHYSEEFEIHFPELLPDFMVLSLEVTPGGPKAGDIITITVTARNLGTLAGSGSVEFLVDGERVRIRSLSLEADREDTLEVEWTAVEGDHTITVRGELTGDANPGNNEETITITVSGPVAQDPGEKDDDEFPYHYLGLGIGITAAVGVVGVLFLGKKTSEEEHARECPRCGEATTYSMEENDHYCWECEEYQGEMGDREQGLATLGAPEASLPERVTPHPDSPKDIDTDQQEGQSDQEEKQSHHETGEDSPEDINTDQKEEQSHHETEAGSP